MLYNVRTQISLIYVLLGECDFIMKKKTTDTVTTTDIIKEKTANMLIFLQVVEEVLKENFRGLGCFQFCFFQSWGPSGD